MGKSVFEGLAAPTTDGIGAGIFGLCLMEGVPHQHTAGGQELAAAVRQIAAWKPINLLLGIKTLADKIAFVRRAIPLFSRRILAITVKKNIARINACDIAQAGTLQRLIATIDETVALQCFTDASLLRFLASSAASV